MVTQYPATNNESKTKFTEKIQLYKSGRKISTGSAIICFAIKGKYSYILKTPLENAENQRLFKNEVMHLSALKTPGHNNVVTLYEVIKFQGKSYMVLEDCGGQSVLDLINLKYKLGETIKQENAAELILQIAEGIRYIHSKNIVHMDLKTDNVILNERTAKIIDLGIAEKEDFNVTEGGAISMYGSLNPPEGLVPRKSTDIYRFSIILYEIITNSPPDQKISIFNRINKLEFMKEIFSGCCEEDWKRRPTIEEVLFAIRSYKKAFYVPYTPPLDKKGNPIESNLEEDECYKENHDTKKLAICFQNMHNDEINVKCWEKTCSTHCSLPIIYKTCQKCGYIQCEKHFKVEYSKKCPLHEKDLAPVLMHQSYLNNFCYTCRSSVKKGRIYYVCPECPYASCTQCLKIVEFPKECLFHKISLEKVDASKVFNIYCVKCKTLFTDCEGMMMCPYCSYTLCRDCYMAKIVIQYTEGNNKSFY
jgi:serine/threonine protein kinase